MRVLLGHHSGGDLHPHFRNLRPAGQQTDRRDRFHGDGPAQHADKSAERVPVGAQRHDGGVGVGEEDTEATRCK